MKTNYLVLGGTGKTGRKVVRNLQERGANVRVGSRQESPAFDWQNSGNWGEVLEGMDKIYVTFQPDLAVPGAKEAILELTEIAKEKGVKKLVLLSGKGEEEAEACEQIVMNSGIDFTIVRATWFNQNFSESFFLDPIKAGMVALPKADVKVPYVDTDDLAEVAVNALLSDNYNGKIYQITGSELFTFPEVIEMIANETGRKITFMEVSLEAYIKILEKIGVPANYIWLINYLFTSVLGAQGNDEVSYDIKTVLGRSAKKFSNFVKETAPTGVWAPFEEV